VPTRPFAPSSAIEPPGPTADERKEDRDLVIVGVGLGRRNRRLLGCPRPFGIEQRKATDHAATSIIDERLSARQIDWTAGVPNSSIDLAHAQEISANGRIAGN
jgi:hypothetical protein